jgi:prepilin-type N-terminal cleavage/methylation domain-containing protein
MREDGVTLTELLVAISVVAILTVALGFTFQGWKGKYRIESEVKELYSDLMDARTKAMTRNRMYFVVLNAGNYQEYADTNDNNVPNAGAGDNPEPEFTNPKPLEYSSGWTGTIAFDTRGLASTAATIVLNIPADTDPDYDCIHVYQSRIRIGKYNGTTSTCDEK